MNDNFDIDITKINSPFELLPDLLLILLQILPHISNLFSLYDNNNNNELQQAQRKFYFGIGGENINSRYQKNQQIINVMKNTKNSQ